MTSDLETQQLNNMMAASVSSQELTGPQGSGVGWLLNWLGDSNGLIAPWWSMQRDIELRTFWRDCDYLAGAIYAMVARIITLPFRVLPYDPTIELHVKQAEEFTNQLVASTEWYRGWNVGMAKFLIDHLTQDNGGFLEVIGEGAPDGPIMGRFLGVVHRDSAKCLGRDSRILMADGTTVPIQKLVNDKSNGPILSVDITGKLVSSQVTGWHETKLGDRHWLRIIPKNSRTYWGKREGLWVTNDHEIMCPSGWRKAEDLAIGDKIYTKYPNLSAGQQQIVVGSMLGDGGLFGKKAKYLSFSHGSKQKDWLDLKISTLSCLSFSEPRRNVIRGFWSASSRTHPFLTDIYERWYQSGSRIVDRQAVVDNFGPLMLAVWYCDNGNLMHAERARPAARIYTNRFSKDDVLWLSALLNEYGIDCVVRSLVNTTGKTEWFIYIKACGAEKLFDLIAPYVPPCLRYKIPDGSLPFNPSLWEHDSDGLFADTIDDIATGDNGHHMLTYCIDVEDTGNFIADGIVVHNCQRTSDPRFPVIYRLDRGEAYKLHHTRVIEYSSMPSPDSRMNYVGFCSVSRCLNIARNLLDIMIFEQEKMGSRPPRTVLVGSKIGTKQLSEAFQMANEVMDAQGLKRFAKTILIGNPDEDINLSMLDLAAVPDGFDKDASVKIGVAAIALALGIDFRELWPATVTGATKADASIQHLKAKGKGFGEIIQMIERLFGRKVLPAHLYLKFDYQDDEEDSLRAEIRRTRSESYRNNLDSGAVTQRIVHEWMLENGELNEVQFEQVELENGRLPDGAPVLTLFATSDPDFHLLLDLGVSDPTDVKANNPLTMMNAISAQYAKAESVYINTSRKRIKSMARQSMAALKELFKLYMSGIQVGRPYLLEEQQSESNSDNESNDNGAGSREGKPAGREEEKSSASPPTQH